MNTSVSVPVFVDADTDPGIVVTPPQPRGVCQHPSVTFSLEIHGMVDAECDACGHRWMTIKVREPLRTKGSK